MNEIGGYFEFEKLIDNEYHEGLIKLNSACSALHYPILAYSIKDALGEDCSDLSIVEPKGFWCNYMVHSNKSGNYAGVTVDDSIKDKLVEFLTGYKNGDEVFSFENSSHAIGTMVFNFNNIESMREKILLFTDLVKANT